MVVWFNRRSIRYYIILYAGYYEEMTRIYRNFLTEKHIDFRVLEWCAPSRLKLGLTLILA